MIKVKICCKVFFFACLQTKTFLTSTNMFCLNVYTFVIDTSCLNLAALSDGLTFAILLINNLKRSKLKREHFEKTF